MPERRYVNGSGYRYGFNGKENDNEVKGEGNQQDYGMRIYDPRLGRFLSIDPLTSGYPWYTPYQFAGNTPIQAIDLDGLEEIHFALAKNTDGSTELTLKSYQEIKVEQNWFDRLFGIKHEQPLNITVEFENQKYYFNDRIDPWANDGKDFGYFVDDPSAAIREGKAKTWDETKVDWYVHNLALEAQELTHANMTFAFQAPRLRYNATVGSATTNKYTETFFEAHPTLKGKVIVHHAFEQQVAKRYPGVFTEAEINSLQNLRGIPIDKNNTLHLSIIRKLWNNFYKANSKATKEDLLKYATELDLKYGYLFKPGTATTSAGGFNFSKGFIISLGLDINENSKDPTCFDQPKKTK